jgi:NADH-quinone oxidoreductase subunit N
MGYLLVALEVGSLMGADAVVFYLVAYFVMTLGAFAVVTVLSEQHRDADQLEDYRGLFWRRPILALVFTAMLLSLAGIPLTAGFLDKFYIVAAGAAVGAWALLLVLVVTSVIGLFYYLRIVMVLYQQPAGSDRNHQPVPRRAPAATLVLAALTVILVWLGVYPTLLIKVIQTAIGSLL